MKTTNTAHPLLDAIRNQENIRNDADLAAELGCAAPTISKTRHGHVPVSDSLRVLIMRRFRWSLKRLDELAPPTAAAE